MTERRIRWLLATCLTVGLALPAPDAAMGATFHVQVTGDGVDANPGDGFCRTGGVTGICTLRAAVQEANALAGDDEIVIDSAGTYPLTLAGPNEDAGATGDLDVTSTITIRPAATLGTALGVVIDGQDTGRIFHVRGTGALTLRLLTLQNGDAHKECADGCDRSGGAILNESATAVSILNSKITTNKAVAGGAVSGVVFVSASTIQSNTADFFGGAIAVAVGAPSGDSVDVRASNVTGNATTAGSGGGIAIWGDATASITGSTFSGNTASQNGGGLLTFDAAAARVVNATFSANSATAGSGGGIQIEAAAPFVANNVTIAANTSKSGGGGLHVANAVPTADVTITNTLIAGNTASQCGGSVTGRYNLVEIPPATDTAPTTPSCATGEGTTTATAADIRLQALATNGYVRETHALGDGSVAIDTGGPCSCEADDERGLPRGVTRDETTKTCGIEPCASDPSRPASGCDIGAYEVFANDDRDDVRNDCDNCPEDANDTQADTDGDGVGDACDSCPGDGSDPPVCGLLETCPCSGTFTTRHAWNVCVQRACKALRQQDPEAVTKADCKDFLADPANATCGYATPEAADKDGDGVPNQIDNCPGKPNGDQLNCDDKKEEARGKRLRGNVCDGDWDGDGVRNDHDDCPYYPNSNQFDWDQDGYGNECDCCPGTDTFAENVNIDGRGCAGVQDPAPDTTFFKAPSSACDDPDDPPAKHCYNTGITTADTDQ